MKEIEVMAIYFCYLTFSKIECIQFILIYNFQIYVEVERARLTHKLSRMQEEEGKVDEAAKIMQELQVKNRNYYFLNKKLNEINYYKI